jgi:hypothetical protein
VENGANAGVLDGLKGDGQDKDAYGWSGSTRNGERRPVDVGFEGAHSNLFALKVCSLAYGYYNYLLSPVEIL